MESPHPSALTGLRFLLRCSGQRNHALAFGDGPQSPG